MPHARTDVSNARPDLVVLHGGGPGCHAAADFQALLPELGDRTTALIDLPGYGQTPLSWPPRPRFTAYADFLEAALDRAGIEVCDILAQSLGGVAAMTLAARPRRRVRRLVAIGSVPLPAPSGIRVDYELGPRARSTYYDSDPAPHSLVDNVMSLEWSDPSKIPGSLIEDRFRASTTRTALAVGRDPASVGVPENLSTVVPEIKAKTLVVWGENDPFAEPAYGNWLASQIPDAEFVQIPRSSHHPQSERPRETARVVAEFLDRPV